MGIAIFNLFLFLMQVSKSKIKTNILLKVGLK